MSRTPNDQQLKAICSIGGVCLSAGAGSGKTFVIVEKLLKMIESKKVDLFDTDENLMRSKVRKYLGKLVVMTFTKKAAGELKTRVVRRIEDELNESEELFYRIVKEEVSSIYIGTIHGFCFRLLRQGIFPGVNPDIKIISEDSRRIQVLKLVKGFGEKKITSYDEELKKLFFSSFDQISEGIFKVVSDPEQRGSWDENVQSNDEIATGNKNFWRRLCDVENLNLLTREFSGHEKYRSESGKTWFKAIEQFNKAGALLLKNDVETQASLSLFFEEFKRIVKPKKIDCSEIHLFLAQLSELRKLFKKYYEEINYFNRNKDLHFKKYYDFFRDIYNHVSYSLTFSRELTFSDLEYLTLRELNSEEVMDAEIKRMFSFFIIDEFQDTSNVQFKIIEKLCSRDFKNLFVVGDEKQAIYRFRGGEISLFTHVKTLLKNNLTLTDNYRSMAPIINFNNDFSKSIFPLGPGFSGIDKFSLLPDCQTIPEFKLTSSQNKKIIHLVEAELGEGIKLSKQEIERTEVEMAFSHLQGLPEGEGSCFLYSKLTPVYFLIETFISENVPFQAQVKIPFRDNPILSLMYAALMGVLSKDTDKNKSKFSLSSWIIGNILKSISNVSYEEHILENHLFVFERDYFFYDLETSFKKLFFNLGINNPDVENNIKIVAELNQQLDGNLEQVFNFLQEKQGSTYSFEYQFGSSDNPVRVMSVHASKGLEFDHVFILGGMTNGVTRSMDTLLGKKVGSFRWKSSFKDIKFQRSPEYIIESHEDKFQDFSEQKRLIYVACTRAVKSLSLLRIVDSKNEPVFVGKNSWVNSYDKVDSSHFNLIRSNFNVNVLDQKNANGKLPFFQRDNFGLVANKSNSKLVVSTEMSVTQLSDLALCSRYFYLKHIVKLNEDDVSLFNEVSNQLPPNYHLDYKTVKSESDFKSDSSISDADRGTYVHGLLEKFIESKGKNEFFHTKTEDELAFNFGKELIDPFFDSEKYSLLSEQELKFDLFTQKISAKPDLIIIPKIDQDHPVEIWDFKTGAINESNREKYFFQLFLYATGVSQFYPEYENFVLKIICLDYQKVEQKTLNLDELRKAVSFILLGMNRPEVKNQNYCSKCEMNKICLIGKSGEIFNQA